MDRGFMGFDEVLLTRAGTRNATNLSWKLILKHPRCSAPGRLFMLILCIFPLILGIARLIISIFRLIVGMLRLIIGISRLMIA